jgi:hypothetical protein
MIRIKNKLFVIVLLAGLLTGSKAFSDDGLFKNKLTFYGDNTEFFAPYRLRQTLLGQQFESSLEILTGPHTSFEGGIFLDHPSAQATNTTVNPIFDFRFHSDDFVGILGTLQTIHRHGFIEPLEVTTLELTRPIEYGLQWLQTGNAYKMDAFLNWQTILNPNQRETFDYGGTAELSLVPGASLLGQYHGYHVGGVSYPGPVWNNFAVAVGPCFELDGPVGAKDSLSLLALNSKIIDLTAYPGPTAGYGFYAKAVVWLFPSFNVFGIDGVYYQSSRTYEEAGVQFEQEIESHILFDAEFRSHWIDNSWANSFRFVVQIPFDVPVSLPRHGE